MKPKILSLFPLIGLLSLGSFNHSVTTSRQIQLEKEEPKTVVVDKSVQINKDAVSTYYASISNTLSGSELRAALETLVYGSFNKEPTSLTYSAVRSYFSGAYRSPTNSNDIVLYYTDKSGNKNSWNKEHIWPNSRGTGDGSGPCGDPWVIAPCDSSDNSGRGNNVYGLVTNSYDPGTGADGALIKYRGIAARAILYTATTWWHHPGKNSNPLELDDTTVYRSGENKMGILSQLLEWNMEYDIDQTEIIRNEYLYGALGIRNPFVDNREYGCRIWGDFNDKTREVCAKYAHQPEKELKITGTLAQIEYHVGDWFDPTGLTVTYYEDNVPTVVTYKCSWNLGLFTATGEYDAIATYKGVSDTYGQKVLVTEKADDPPITPDPGDSGSSDVAPEEPPTNNGGGGCSLSITGGSGSILFIASSALLFFAIRQAIRSKKKEDK